MINTSHTTTLTPYPEIRQLKSCCATLRQVVPKQDLVAALTATANKVYEAGRQHDSYRGRHSRPRRCIHRSIVTTIRLASLVTRPNVLPLQHLRRTHIRHVLLQTISEHQHTCRKRTPQLGVSIKARTNRPLHSKYRAESFIKPMKPYLAVQPFARWRHSSITK